MGIAPVPGDIVIAARRQLTIFWGACIVILALGVVVACSNQPTMAGKAGSAVFFGFFIALCAFLWWYRNRLRPRIQVTGDEIRYFSRNAIRRACESCGWAFT
jgi:O-antigen/teichoic acid export membrane protein